MLDLTFRTVSKDDYYCDTGIDFEESTCDLSYGEKNFHRAYKQMTAFFACELIRRHETDLFTSYFKSIRPLSNRLYYKFMAHTCLQYFNLACLVPIYAFCAHDHYLLPERPHYLQQVDHYSPSEIGITLA